jgi:tetratricopeptide (TPR) repeat protein
VFDYQVYGFDRPWGWHLTSILIHTGAAVALFFAVSALLSAMAERLGASARSGIAFVVAWIWAIHPLHTSAVTYVSGRADPLAALFGFAGLALALTGLHAQSRWWFWRLGAAFCFLLAMLSKESGMIFLPLWLLVLAWRKETRRRLIPWVPLTVILVACYSGLRFSAEKVAPPQPPPTPLAIRPILAARAFAGYAGLFLAPINLRMERDVTTHPLDTPEATLRQARALEYQTLAGVLLLMAFVFWITRSMRHNPVAALCLAAFVIAYLPISNLFPLNATIAEHWLYVPSAFLLMATAISFHQALPQPGARSLVAVVACWAVLLGVRTVLRQADWRDQRTFVERTIAAGGNSARMLMNLGNVEFATGHQDAALALYREALRRTPDQPIIWLGYASILVRARDFPHAHEALERAETSPLLTADCLVLRATLENAESGTDPGELLRKAVTAAPENWGIRKRYIEYLHERGQQQEALRELHDFLQRHPFRAESWRMLATLLEEQHQSALATEAWREAAVRDVRDKDSRAALERLSSAVGNAR